MKSRNSGFGIWGSGLGSSLGLGFFLISSSLVGAEEPSSAGAEPSLKITVRVQDYAQVPRKTLEQAKSEAMAILGQTGVKVVWLDCPRPAERVQTPRACAEPFRPSDIALRILPKSMAERLPVSGDAFGFASQSTDNRPSFVANVFYHRVEALAETVGFSRAATLRYVMAHEIGHLLLHTVAHSPTGIMHARWNREDLLRHLVFTPREAQLIRADVRERLSLQEATSITKLASHK